MYQNLGAFISTLKAEQISAERREILQTLIDYIQARKNQSAPTRLNFICTHNSRRSHLSQIWAQTMAHHFNLSNVFCYSGGTEATAMFAMVAQSLQETGFLVKKISDTSNPVFAIKYNENECAIIGFSKKWNDVFNPKSGFAAIMTCSQADLACPIISGAEMRIPIKYEDPKQFDGMSNQAEKYLETSKLIATEMFYIFSQIK